MDTRWLGALLATYRLAHLLSKDDGPWFVFTRLRDWTDGKRAQEQAAGIERGLWASLDEGLRCPYCTGMWAALLCLWLVRRGSWPGNLFLAWMGLAGAQALLQAWTDKESYP